MCVINLQTEHQSQRRLLQPHLLPELSESPIRREIYDLVRGTIKVYGPLPQLHIGAVAPFYYKFTAQRWNNRGLFP